MSMTLKQAAQQALDIQDACNLSGVAGAFHRVCSDVLWPEARRIGQGTEWVNSHPIVTLFLDKMADLNRRAEFGPAYLAVTDIAEASEVKIEGICNHCGSHGIAGEECHNCEPSDELGPMVFQASVIAEQT